MFTADFLPRCIVCNAVFLIAMPSVRLSVRHTRVICDKTNESSANILTPYERKIYLLFRTQEWLVGDVPFYLKFCVKLTHPASKTAIFNRYSLVAAQTLDLAKKSKLSLIGSRHELTNEPKMNSVPCPYPPPKEGSKNAN